MIVHSAVDKGFEIKLPCSKKEAADGSPLSRAIEDYAVVYLGSAVFKIARLLIIAVFCVHLFACAFYRVKLESAYSLDDVTAFYTSRNIDMQVWSMTF